MQQVVHDAGCARGLGLSFCYSATPSQGTLLPMLTWGVTADIEQAPTVAWWR